MRILLFLFIIVTFVYYGKKGYGEKNLDQEQKEYTQTSVTKSVFSEKIDTFMLSEVGVGARGQSIFIDKNGEELVYMNIPPTFKGSYNESPQTYDRKGVDVGEYFQVKLKTINGKNKIIDVLKHIDGYKFDYSSLKKKYKYIKAKFHEFSEGDYEHYIFLNEKNEEITIDFTSLEDGIHSGGNLKKGRFYHIFYIKEKLYDAAFGEYGDFYTIKKMVLIN
jgi:hypothetical protein